jgi:hypothetical protein
MSTVKNVIILQNSHLSFGMDISKIYNPKKYNLILITNDFCFKKIAERNQQYFFYSVHVVSDFTFQFIEKLIIDIVQSGLPIDIVTNAEESMILCGKLRVRFGLSENDNDRFINKVTMKKILKQDNVVVPQYIKFEKSAYTCNPDEYLKFITHTIPFPLFAKPVDQLSCVGVAKIDNEPQLKSWCEKILVDDFEYEIDEFISGVIFNCDSFSKKGKIIHTQVSKCFHSCFDFILGKTKGSIVLPENHADAILLKKYTSKILQCFAVISGVTHLEVIKTAENNLIFLEMAHRSPGLLIPDVYKKYIGLNTIESHILLQIDEEYFPSVNYGPFAAWVAFPKKRGVVKKLNYLPIKSPHQLTWAIQIGDKLKDTIIGRDYAGTALLWNDNYKILNDDFYVANNFLAYSSIK